MAIAQLHCQIITRADGRSAVACAAYRSGTRIECGRDGRVHDYTRKGGVVHAEVLLPQDAADAQRERLAAEAGEAARRDALERGLPEEQAQAAQEAACRRVRAEQEHAAPEAWRDRSALWNAVEGAERAKNAQLSREVEFALPNELSRDERVELAREYVMSEFVARGMVADLAVHEPHREEGEPGNPHCHVMLTMRALDGEGGFKPKTETLYAMRRERGGEVERVPAAEAKEREAQGWAKMYTYLVDGEKVDLTRDEAAEVAPGEKPTRRQPVGQSRRVADWDERDRVELWRRAWERECNRALERSHRERECGGEAPSIDMRSYERQGIDREPSLREGPAVTAMERAQRRRCREEGRPYEPVTEVRAENIARLERAVERAWASIELIRAQADLRRERAREAWERGRDLARVRMDEARERVKDRLGEPIRDIREHVKGIGMHAADRLRALREEAERLRQEAERERQRAEEAARKYSGLSERETEAYQLMEEVRDLRHRASAAWEREDAEGDEPDHSHSISLYEEADELEHVDACEVLRGLSDGELLRLAARYVEQEGWRTGDYVSAPNVLNNVVEERYGLTWDHMANELERDRQRQAAEPERAPEPGLRSLGSVVAAAKEQSRIAEGRGERLPKYPTPQWVDREFPREQWLDYGRNHNHGWERDR